MPVFQKDGRNFLFIHVPKAGGSSVESAFKNAGYVARYLDGKVGAGTLNDVLRCTPQHMHAAMLRQHFRLGRFDAIFMIVRDPIARFRSEYLWRNREREPDPSAGAVEDWAHACFAAYKTDHYLFDNHIRPQADFEVKGTLVYRIEDGLDAAFADLNGRFDLGIAPKPPHVRAAHHVTAASSSAVTISEKLSERLQHFYRRDFIEYGYGAVPVPLRTRLIATPPGQFAARYYRAIKHAR